MDEKGKRKRKDFFLWTKGMLKYTPLCYDILWKVRVMDEMLLLAMYDF